MNTDGGADEDEQPEPPRTPRRPKRGIKAIEATARRNYAMSAGVQRDLQQANSRIRALVDSIDLSAVAAVESMMQSQISDITAAADRYAKTVLADFNATIAAAQAQEARRLAQIVTPALRHWEAQSAILSSSMVRWAREYQTRTLSTFAHLAEAAERTLALFLPPNWRGLEAEQVEAAARLAEEEGIPTAWVPRDKILIELLQAESQGDRRRILVQRRDEIAADCSAVLETIDAEELSILTDLASGLVRGMRSEAADFGTQCGATNLIDKLIRDIALRGETGLNHPRSWVGYGTFQKAIIPVSDDLDVAAIRPAAALSALIPALEPFWPPAPIPRLYNRHATAHSPGPEQCTPANAVISAMLLVSLLRETKASGW